MATPFGTTRRRRVSFFLICWGYVIGAILFRATSNPDRILDALTLPGAVYRGTRNILQKFAGSAGVSSVVMLAVYVILALIVVTVGVYILDKFAFESTKLLQDGFEESIFVLYFLIASLSGVILTTAAFVTGQTTNRDGVPVRVYPNWGVFGEVFSFVLSIGPQFLSIAIVGILISLLTSYIP